MKVICNLLVNIYLMKCWCIFLFCVEFFNIYELIIWKFYVIEFVFIKNIIVK